MNKLLRKIAAPAALVLGLGGAATAAELIRTSIEDAQAQAVVEQPLTVAAASAENLASAFRGATRAAMPGVVYVQVETTRNASSRIPEQFRDTPFEDFFRNAPRGNAPPQRGSGSGFIIRPDGYVLTNNHVVENASRVTVVMTDKTEHTAEVVGRDPNTDVAVLKIDAENLPVVRFGDSDVLEIGDWVLALGYPLSLGETVTAGIVSAKGRNINIIQRTDEATIPLENFIQTDAAINPGNSGGPLVDLQGRVIGINSAIASQTGFNAGYGFAVPINLARRVSEDLIRYGVVHRPRLGVEIADPTPADVEVFRLPSADGSVVKAVQAGPAKDAGIQLGDVIVGIDGRPVEDTGDLMETVARRQPGERVVLDVIRYGKRERLTVQLGTFETAAPPPATAKVPEPDAVARLGLQLSNVTPELVQRLELGSTEGVVVLGVEPGTSAPAQLRGLRIVRLNGRQVRTIEDVRAAAEGLAPGEAVSIIASRPNGEELIVNYRLRN